MDKDESAALVEPRKTKKKRKKSPPLDINGADHPNNWDWPDQMPVDEYKRRALIIRRLPAQSGDDKRFKYQMLGKMGEYYSPKGMMVRENLGV